MEAELLNNAEPLEESPIKELTRDDSKEKVYTFKEIKDFLENISDSTHKIEEDLKSLINSQVSKQQESINTLNEKLEKLENLNSVFDKLEKQNNDLKEDLKRGFEVERKIKEEKESEQIRIQKELLNQLIRKNKTSKQFKGYFSVLGRKGLTDMFLKSVTSNNKKTSHKNRITFDVVERQIRSPYCQGDTAIKLINRLKESLNLASTNSVNILQLFRNILQKLDTEKKTLIPEFVKNEILANLDDAEMEYLRNNRSFIPILKSTINEKFEKIEAILTRNPPSYMLKDSIEKLRKILMNSNLTIDDNFYRELRLTEKELLSKMNSRIDNVSILVYSSKIKNWREKINSLLPGSKRVSDHLESALVYLQSIIKGLENNKVVENDVYRLLLLLNKEEIFLRKRRVPEDLINNLQDFKKDLEMNVYSKISLNNAKKYYEILSLLKRKLISRQVEA